MSVLVANSIERYIVFSFYNHRRESHSLWMSTIARRNLWIPCLLASNSSIMFVHEERNNENENRKTDWPRKTGIFDCTRDSTPAARLVPPNNYLVGVPWPCRQTTNIIPPDKNSALRPEDQHPQKTIPTFSPPSKPIGQNPCIRKANRGRAQA